MTVLWLLTYLILDECLFNFIILFCISFAF